METFNKMTKEFDKAMNKNTEMLLSCIIGILLYCACLMALCMEVLPIVTWIARGAIAMCIIRSFQKLHGCYKTYKLCKEAKKLEAVIRDLCEKDDSIVKIIDNHYYDDIFKE